MARILSAALRLGAADSVLFDHVAGMVRDAGGTPSGLAMPLVDSTSLFNSLALAEHHQPDVLDALGVSVLENAERLSPAMIGSLLRALRAAADQGSVPSPTLSLSFSRSLPQKALCGGIPCPFWEPLARSWSHFVGMYGQNLTRSLEN